MCPESSFRDNLVAMETEVEDLRKTAGDLRQQNKARDKASSEIKRLKGIITSQDEMVCD